MGFGFFYKMEIVNDAYRFGSRTESNNKNFFFNLFLMKDPPDSSLLG